MCITEKHKTRHKNSAKKWQLVEGKIIISRENKREVKEK